MTTKKFLAYLAASILTMLMISEVVPTPAAASYCDPRFPNCQYLGHGGRTYGRRSGGQGYGGSGVGNSATTKQIKSKQNK